ncbi:MAG: hypothetical protein ABR927_17335 [Bacteroidales bacterium]|jgi:hypothetical protein
MGILGSISGNASKWIKCKWCGKSFDTFDSYDSSTDFCSEKCEKEYGDDRFGPEDNYAPEPEIVYKAITKKIIQEKLIYGKTFEAWIALSLGVYVFGKDGKLEKSELEELRRNIKRVFKIDVIDDVHFYDNVIDHFQGDSEKELAEITGKDFKEEDLKKNQKEDLIRIINIIDSIEEIGTFFDPRTKLQLMDIIVQTNNGLGRKNSDREDAKARFEVYELLGISIKDYNELKHILDKSSRKRRIPDMPE